MNDIEYRHSDFGLIDFLVQRMTFDGQDFLRRLIHVFGEVHAYQINMDKALEGLVKSLKALETDFGKTNADFGDLITSAKLVKSEVSIYRNEHLLNFESVLKGPRLIKSLKKWVIIEACNDLAIDDDILKYVGAYCCLTLIGQKLAKHLENTVFRLLMDGKEFLSERAHRDLARLLNRAHLVFGAKEKSFEDKIRSHYFFLNYYASAKNRQSVTDWKGATDREFRKATIQIYEDVREGQLNSIIKALAIILGLPIHLVMLVPIFSAYLYDWIITIDLSKGLVLFDMSKIFSDGAKVKAGVDSYVQSSKILVRPIPKFLHDVLLKQLLINSNANNVKELVGKIDAFNDQNQVSRILNTTAKFAIKSCHIDPFDASILSGDFRGIPAAKTYYRLTTRQSSWDSSNRFYQEIGWGESVDFVDGLDFGSLVVVKDEVLTDVFAHISFNIEKLRPPNRCSAERLLEFHDEFCHYSATFTIFCLALRNANPISLLSSDLNIENRFIVIDDKHVLGAASALPVVITNSLTTQLTYWQEHCAKLSMRLHKLNYSNKEFMSLLQGVIDQKNTPLFVLSEKPYVASVARVSASWNSQLVENFSRHFWESKFSQVGISSRFSAAQLRHQSSGALTWGGDSDFVLREFVEAISKAQEKVLQELRVNPIRGLSRR